MTTRGNAVFDATFNLRLLADISDRLPLVCEAKLLMDLKPSHSFVHEGFEYFIVRDVCGHKRTANGMKFYVKWDGFGSEYDTWEPLSTVEKLKCFKRYKRVHMTGH